MRQGQRAGGSMRRMFNGWNGSDGGGCGLRSAAGGTRRLGGALLLLCCFFLRDLLLVVLVHDPSHVGAGFAKWRHSLILLDALRARVVCSQRLNQIEIVALQKFAQIAAS